MRRDIAYESWLTKRSHHRNPLFRSPILATARRFSVAGVYHLLTSAYPPTNAASSKSADAVHGISVPTDDIKRSDTKGPEVILRPFILPCWRADLRRRRLHNPPGFLLLHQCHLAVFDQHRKGPGRQQPCGRVKIHPDGFVNSEMHRPHCDTGSSGTCCPPMPHTKVPARYA